MTQPWHVCVLIPARNEEALLPRCLKSVTRACEMLPGAMTWDVVVAVDSSFDKTREIAESMVPGSGTVVEIGAGRVGLARAAAAAAALARYRGAPSRCWLAHTDADCSVPPSWLCEQLALAAEQDAEAIAGSVDVDSFEEHSAVVEGRFRATYVIAPDGSHAHIHGANLGVRADAYLRAGGWGDLASAEDHDLWRRLVLTGAKTVATSRTRVLTSGRREGRAPHGFAEALAAHNEAAL